MSGIVLDMCAKKKKKTENTSQGQFKLQEYISEK